MNEEIVAQSLDKVALSLIKLGNNDAATNMGAIEGLGLKIANAIEIHAKAMTKIADEINKIACVLESCEITIKNI